MTAYTNRMRTLRNDYARFARNDELDEDERVGDERGWKQVRCLSVSSSIIVVVALGGGRLITARCVDAWPIGARRRVSSAVASAAVRSPHRHRFVVLVRSLSLF